MIRALLVALLVSSAQAEPTELELAYQREFSYLQAEKEALRSRLDALDGEADRRVASAEGELERLQARLLALESRRAEQEELLAAAMRDADGVTEAEELLEATLFQAESSLGDELPASETPEQAAAALRAAFERGADRVAEAGRVRKESGSWFLQDGTKVDGEIVHVGRIAAFGVGPGSGALIPVGEGKLQLRDTQAAGTAEALARGERPDTLGLFLFEDTGKRVEEAPEKTLWTKLEAGGIVGWVILSLGLVALVFSALRLLILSGAGRGAVAVRAALARLDQGRWDDALQLVKRSGGAAPRVMTALLPLGPSHRQRLEDRAAEAILLETPRIERFATAILVIAAVAPLLGLLGTVTGMIGTFEIITEFGTGDPRMLSGGISEALVTTQLGLIVAIPALLVGNLLNKRAEAVIASLEVAALAVINRADASDPSPAASGWDDDELTQSGEVRALEVRPAHG